MAALPKFLALVVSLSTLASLPAAAQETGSGQMRIAVANELRTHARQIAAIACKLAEDTDPERSAQDLMTKMAEYDLFLAVLRDGNEDFGISDPETRRKTLATIDTVEAAWASTRESATQIVTNGATPERVSDIVTQNSDLLAAAEILAVEVSSQYSNSAQLVQADAFLLELAGRQRSLIQEMDINSCLVGLGLQGEEAKARLSSNLQSFGATLDALRNGMPSAGVRQPPTPAIAASLDDVHAGWVIIEPKLQEILAGSAQDEATDAENQSILEDMMNSMTEAQQLYFEAFHS